MTRFRSNPRWRRITRVRWLGCRVFHQFSAKPVGRRLLTDSISSNRTRRRHSPNTVTLKCRGVMQYRTKVTSQVKPNARRSKPKAEKTNVFILSVGSCGRKNDSGGVTCPLQNSDGTERPQSGQSPPNKQPNRRSNADKARAASSFPSSPREERVGRGPRRGGTNRNGPPLPNPPPSAHLRCAPAWLCEPRRSRRRRRADGGEGEIQELDAALRIRRVQSRNSQRPDFTHRPLCC